MEQQWDINIELSVAYNTETGINNQESSTYSKQTFRATRPEDMIITVIPHSYASFSSHESKS